MATVTSEADKITQSAVQSFAGTPSDRLRTVLQALVRHLHEFAKEVRLTPEEWATGIQFMTDTGAITDDKRQEFILLSDTLGLSALVDTLADDSMLTGATEATVLGPFYVPDSPFRPNGGSTIERPSGIPTLVHGRVTSDDGAPIAGAVLDVWQNGADRLYTVQDPDAPPTNFRGRFVTAEDGTYSFIGVRPTDYTVPFDGPVGHMFDATGRHPWRPAHLHLIVTAQGHKPLTTHIFDSTSKYLDSDTVFAVKKSLIRTFNEHTADDPDRPDGIEGAWVDVENDIVLARLR